MEITARNRKTGEKVKWANIVIDEISTYDSNPNYISFIYHHKDKMLTQSWNAIDTTEWQITFDIT